MNHCNGAALISHPGLWIGRCCQAPVLGSSLTARFSTDGLPSGAKPSVAEMNGWMDRSVLGSIPGSLASSLLRLSERLLKRRKINGKCFTSSLSLSLNKISKQTKLRDPIEVKLLSYNYIFMGNSALLSLS